MPELKILYKTSVHPARQEQDGTTHEERLTFKLLKVSEWCCEKMQKCWGEEKFDFARTTLSNDREHKACLNFTFGDDDFDSIADHEYVFIDFCPFCGAKIVTTETERVLVEYKKVTKTVEQCETTEKPMAVQSDISTLDDTK